MKKNSTKHKLLKQRKGVRRERLMEEGVYNIHKEKTFKDKKKFSRKKKHKNSNI